MSLRIPDQIEYNYVTGFVNDVIDNINDRITRLKASHAKVKVGITSRDPQDFFDDQLKRYDWDRMIIIYDSQSKKFINDLILHQVNISWVNLDDEEHDSTGNYTLYALVRE